MEVRHLRVVGRVQGVGFRWFIRQRARELGLSGWVRNRQDGSVEIAAAGEPPAIARLESSARHGPSGAAVSGIEALPAEGVGDLPRPFVILK